MISHAWHGNISRNLTRLISQVSLMPIMYIVLMTSVYLTVLIREVAVILSQIISSRSSKVCVRTFWTPNKEA